MSQSGWCRLGWDTPSKAVVVNGRGSGCVLYTVGHHVEALITEAGVSDLESLGLDDAPVGISIWEGVLKSAHVLTPDANEYDSWLDGAFREPTSEEWAAIRQNKCPWDEN